MARTADRQSVKKPIQKSRIWYVAFYIRLSREDKHGKDESESIINQRLILTDFLEQQNDGDEYIYVNEYVDDGISGTTDEERESFQRLLADIRKGKVNCVIVKNLARSFRNNGDQSFYLGDWFPRYNVRFISLYQQTIDTYKDPKNAGNIAVPVQGVLNEEHARGTSESVRRTFDAKREKGLHIGSFAPFGYMKDPDNKNHLIVDEEAADHVRMIFSWFLNGISQNAIIHKLNESGILCPSAYKKSKGLKYQNPNTVNDLSLWSTISVRNILRNRIYVGDMVQGRYRMKSYKIHIQENVPEEEWFIVENTHEPIISREDFKKVQSLLMKDTRTAPGKNKLYLFSGLLRCGDCKKGMSRSTVGKNTYYYCRTYKNQLKTACTKHMIKHNELEQGVLQSIKQLIYIAADFSKILSHIQATPQQKNQSLRLQKLITSKEKELSGITYYRRSIYQDWKDGEITHDDYIDMRKEYECQIKELGKKIDTLRKEKDELESIENLENPLLSSFRKHANIDKLTRDLLIDLVDQITVYEGKKIKIRFKFSFLFLIM